MHELITKSMPFEMKANTKTRQFEGYASTFGNMDLVGDVIEKGAFRKTVGERGPMGSNDIKILWEHREPFGMPTKMHEDEHGLYVIGQASDTVENKDRLQYMIDGVVKSMSIGFTIPEKKSWWEEDEDAPWGMVRHITEVKLYEFSPVTFPANEEAAIASVRKHAEMNMLLRSFGRDDIVKAARELKSVEPSVIAEAVDALTKVYEEITGVRKEAPAFTQVQPSSLGVTPTVVTSTVVGPIIDTVTEKDGPPVLVDEHDPEEVEKALQSALDEITLKSVLDGLDFSR